MTEQDAIDMVESQERMADALERIAAALETPANRVTGPDVPLQPLWIYEPAVNSINVGDEEGRLRERCDRLNVENAQLKERAETLNQWLIKAESDSRFWQERAENCHMRIRVMNDAKEARVLLEAFVNDARIGGVDDLVSRARRWLEKQTTTGKDTEE